MFKLSKDDRERREQMRGKYASQLHWYGVMTHWGQEDRLKRELESAFSGADLREVFVPEFVQTECPGKKTRSEKLFGGYLFVQCEMRDEIYFQICKFPQVHRILGLSYRIPSVIDDFEIAHLKRLLVFQPKPRMMQRCASGQMVKVVDGLLKGMTGQVVQVNAEHIKIETSFSFLGYDSGICVSLPHASVRPFASRTSETSIGNVAVA